MGVITAAARVWNEIFLHEHATLGGTADDLWSLELELTFDIFIRTLYVMPKGKAVGQSGFSVELLLVFPRGGTEQRVFYDAMMADLRSARIPPSWRVVVYALLVKPGRDKNPDVIAERREIAIMEQAMKLALQGVRFTAYVPLAGKIAQAQLGWLGGAGCGDAGVQLEHAIQQARPAALWIEATWSYASPALRTAVARASTSAPCSRRSCACPSCSSRAGPRAAPCGHTTRAMCGGHLACMLSHRHAPDLAAACASPSSTLPTAVSTAPSSSIAHSRPHSRHGMPTAWRPKPMAGTAAVGSNDAILTFNKQHRIARVLVL